MSPALERLLHRSATLSVIAFMGGFATWMHVRVGETRQVLDRRQSQVDALRELHQACELGHRPSADQLREAAQLFPGMELSCAAIEDALYLTFAPERIAADHNAVAVTIR